LSSFAQLANCSCKTGGMRIWKWTTVSGIDASPLIHFLGRGGKERMDGRCPQDAIVAGTEAGAKPCNQSDCTQGTSVGSSVFTQRGLNRFPEMRTAKSRAHRGTTSTAIPITVAQCQTTEQKTAERPDSPSHRMPRSHPTCIARFYPTWPQRHALLAASDRPQRKTHQLLS
jgi:hypothetical protein